MDASVSKDAKRRSIRFSAAAMLSSIADRESSIFSIIYQKDNIYIAI